MNELIQVAERQIGDGTIQTVNARDLHAFLEVGKDFSTWIKGRIEQYSFVEHHDFAAFDAAPQNGGAGNRGHRVEYAISLDMAKELAMVERNNKGKQARQYFIECERHRNPPSLGGGGCQRFLISAAKQNKGKYMNKLTYGIGVNDLSYRVHVQEELTKDGGKKIRKTVFICNYYAAWTSMLKRCYSKKFLESRPTYTGTSVCSEWLYASAFKKWMEQQDWNGKCLDKDIVVPRSKLYSPDTCAFVLQATNSFVTASDACRGDYPIGVHLLTRTGKYHAYCKNPFTGKQEHLGYFSTPEEAHEVWRKRKHELAQLVAATESDPRVVEALKKRYSFEEWYK